MRALMGVEMPESNAPSVPSSPSSSGSTDKEEFAPPAQVDENDVGPDLGPEPGLDDFSRSIADCLDSFLPELRLGSGTSSCCGGSTSSNTSELEGLLEGEPMAFFGSEEEEHQLDTLDSFFPQAVMQHGAAAEEGDGEADAASSPTFSISPPPAQTWTIPPLPTSSHMHEKPCGEEMLRELARFLIEERSFTQAIENVFEEEGAPAEQLSLQQRQSVVLDVFQERVDTFLLRFNVTMEELLVLVDERKARRAPVPVKTEAALYKSKSNKKQNAVAHQEEEEEEEEELVLNKSLTLYSQSPRRCSHTNFSFPKPRSSSLSMLTTKEEAIEQQPVGECAATFASGKVDSGSEPQHGPDGLLAPRRPDAGCAGEHSRDHWHTLGAAKALQADGDQHGH